MIAVRDNPATTLACPVCAIVFEPAGPQRFCSTGCRQAAWRAKQAAPVEPVVARCDTVYARTTPSKAAFEDAEQKEVKLSS